MAQEMTTIKADYRCEQPGGGVAVKIGTESTARVWQTDPGEKEGLELQVTSFSLARCPGCFSFEANLMGELLVKGRALNSFMTYEVYDADEAKWVPVLKNVKCVSVKK